MKKKSNGKKIIMLITGILILFLVGLPLFNLLKWKLSGDEEIGNTIIIGHRGAGNLAPENTLKAVDSGIAHKASFIEIDIRQTKDGELIIMHDKTVDRTTNGKGEVKNLTLKEILALDASKSFGQKNGTTQVPTLKEVLNEVKKSDSKLLIEIKDPELYPGLVTKLTDLVNETEMQDRILVNSFNYGVLSQVKKNLPKAETGVFNLGGEKISSYKNVEFICPSWYSILYFPSIIEKIHKKGCKAFVWTVDSPMIMRYLISKNVDGIITNRPDLLQKIIN